LPRAPPSQWAEIQSVFSDFAAPDLSGPVFSGKRLEDIFRVYRIFFQ
jgi:hypothetical protein